MEGRACQRNFHMTSSSKAPKYLWTKEEESTLVECLMELVSTSSWRFDNGIFKPEYHSQLARMVAQKMSRRNN
uniref:Retrotransposon protein n=1 Tax=Cucumis melo TaxID=3656 RepID=A0A9I9E8F1_CUCME